MKHLRTVSTGRLLAMIAGLVALIAAGTTIALAAGSGPVPPRKPLANAIRAALAAKAPVGITARISFTNHLIDSADIQGSDPILTGGSGRLWLTQGHLRLELQSDSGMDPQLVFNDGSFWAYDPTSKTVYEGTIPKGVGARTDRRASTEADHALPSIARIQSELNKLARHLIISGAIPSDVGGQAAYTVRVAPRHDGALLGSAELAWDAIRGVPLRIAVYASGGGAPVLELKVTDISYGPVPLSNFIAPPSGAKVVKIATPNAARAGAAMHRAQRLHGALKRARERAARYTTVAAIARQLRFTLSAPPSVAGLPRRGARLLEWGGSRAALLMYGQGLGGVIVIEHAASGKTPASSAQQGDGHGGLSLPSVSINGVTGHELDTALGTVVEFTRAGVSYVVLGSVTPPAAEAAARAL